MANHASGMERKLRTICLAVLLAGAADAACVYLWFRSVEREIAPARNLAAEAAIVPFSGFGDLSGVDSETSRRLDATVALYRDKRIRYILCIGGARPSMRMWGAERMRQILLADGVPENAVLMDLRSNDTISNINEALRILKERNLGSAIVVSSPPQLVRIRRILAAAGFPGRIDLAPYDYSNCSPEATWLEVWLQIHHEWLASGAHAMLPPSLYRHFIDMTRR